MRTLKRKLLQLKEHLVKMNLLILVGDIYRARDAGTEAGSSVR